MGCWYGKSLCFLLECARESGKDLDIIGVDHFKGAYEDWSQIAEAETTDIEAACRANCERVGYPFRLYRRESDYAAAFYPSEYFDFIFLDASHDYESVCVDILAWKAKLDPAGVLAGHDYNLDGVRRAVSGLLGPVRIQGKCWLWTPPT